MNVNQKIRVLKRLDNKWWSEENLSHEMGEAMGGEFYNGTHTFNHYLQKRRQLMEQLELDEEILYDTMTPMIYKEGNGLEKRGHFMGNYYEFTDNSNLLQRYVMSLGD